MCGVLPAIGTMSGRLRLGYREAEALADSAAFATGPRLRGHEFHHSTVTPAAGVTPAWRLSARGRQHVEGFVEPNLHASYLHAQWAATPAVASRFVTAAARAEVAA